MCHNTVSSNNNLKKQMEPNTEVQTQTQTLRKPRSFYGTGKFKWLIYPDYWKKQWGPKPCLGTVYADDEFYAIREAYNRGLLTMNYTFEPQAVLIGPAKATTPTTTTTR